MMDWKSSLSTTGQPRIGASVLVFVLNGLIVTVACAQSYKTTPVRLSGLGEAEVDVTNVSMMLPQQIALHAQQLMQQERHEEMLVFCEQSLRELKSDGGAAAANSGATFDPMGMLRKTIHRTLQLYRHTALTKLKRYEAAVSVIREIEAESATGTGFDDAGDVIKVQTAILLLDVGRNALADEILAEVDLEKTPTEMRGLVEPQYNIASAYQAWLKRDDTEAARLAQSVLDVGAQEAGSWDMANQMHRMVARSVLLQCQLRTKEIDAALRDYHDLHRANINVFGRLAQISLATPLETLDRSFRPTPSQYFPFEHLSKAKGAQVARLAWEVLVNSKNRLIDERVLRVGKQREAARDAVWMAQYEAAIVKARANVSNVAATQQAEQLLGGVKIGSDFPRAQFLDGNVFRNQELRNLTGVAASQWMTDATELDRRQHQLRFDALNAIASEASQRFWDRISTTDLINHVDDSAQSSSAWITAEDVLGRFEDGTVLLDIVRFPAPVVRNRGSQEPPGWIDRYGVFVVDDRQIEWFDLGEASDWDTELTQGLCELRDPLDSKLQQWGSLSARFLDATGLAKRLAASTEASGQHRLVVSPDDQFWLVSWPALKVDDETFLVERCDVLLVDHFRKHFRMLGKDDVAEQRDLGGKAVVFADPNFDLSPKDWHAVESELPGGVEVSLVSTEPMSKGSCLPEVSRLPGTLTEANAIEESWQDRADGDLQLFVQNKALESQLSRVDQPDLLVFSTHGYFLPQASTLIRKRDAADESNVAAVPQRVQADPFYRCGLLLSGCNHSHRWSQLRAADGILTGAEIIYLPLEGTRLVMLSACETGVGDVRNGEGVKGLRQAFQIAGADSVIASSWPVDDRATALLMMDFFDKYELNAAPEKALAESQRIRIMDRRKRFGVAHPFFWSAFMCSR